MKVREVKNIIISIDKNENNALQIVKDSNRIDEKKLIKYIQSFNIEKILLNEVYIVNNGWDIKLEVIVK